VIRKFLFLSQQARIGFERDLEALKSDESAFSFSDLQFDEMETFEHTKCKPLSIPLVVCAKSRRILGFSVASMPAKGPLARTARKKYGPRADHRRREAQLLLARVRPVTFPEVTFTTDENPHYPRWLKSQFPQARHKTTPGRRGAIVGQGELKKVGFDPLFALNHTAAMFRANVNRLFRRTWCTTKRADRLLAHLYLYAHFHNTQLIQA
jgi:hypothetical protein